MEISNSYVNTDFSAEISSKSDSDNGEKEKDGRAEGKVEGSDDNPMEPIFGPSAPQAKSFDPEVVKASIYEDFQHAKTGKRLTEKEAEFDVRMKCLQGW